MNEFIEIFQSSSTLWILTGIFLLILEFAVPGLIIFFFGLGAILTGLLCLVVDMNLDTQLLVFTLSSIAMLLVLRRYLKPLFSPSGENGEPDIQEFEGQRAKVTEAIVPGVTGKVEFHGAEWKAEADTALNVGERVVITARENLTLIVSKPEHGE